MDQISCSCDTHVLKKCTTLHRSRTSFYTFWLRSYTGTHTLRTHPPMQHVFMRVCVLVPLNATPLTRTPRNDFLTSLLSFFSLSWPLVQGTKEWMFPLCEVAARLCRLGRLRKRVEGVLEPIPSLVLSVPVSPSLVECWPWVQPGRNPGDICSPTYLPRPHPSSSIVLPSLFLVFILSCLRKKSECQTPCA